MKEVALSPVRGVISGYTPTPAQERLATALLDPGMPGDLGALARATENEEADVRAWFQNPQFAAWIQEELSTAALAFVPLAWREILRMAMDQGADPATRLRALDRIVQRFDPDWSRQEGRKSQARELGKAYAQHQVRALREGIDRGKRLGREPR